MTTLALIQSARNPEFTKLPQETISKMLADILTGEKIPGTIIFKDKTAELKCHQLYIEFYLNENNLAEAAESACCAHEKMQSTHRA